MKTSVSPPPSPLGNSVGHVAPNNPPDALPLPRPAVFILRRCRGGVNGKGALLAGDTTQCVGVGRVCHAEGWVCTEPRALHRERV